MLVAYLLFRLHQLGRRNKKKMEHWLLLLLLLLFTTTATTAAAEIKLFIIRIMLITSLVLGWSRRGGRTMSDWRFARRVASGR